MEDKFKLIECNDSDVIEIANNTYKINRVRKALNKASNSSLGYALKNELKSQGIIISLDNSDALFNQGLSCEILNLGSSNWKKGKLRFKVSVEFYIEEDEPHKNNIISEPESPLDDLRRLINEENSK
jgi:hypothetical protein